MLDLRLSVFIVLTAILLYTTTYSVIYNSYLDTSNPALTHLPHPLHDTHYFASKSNFLNVYFIKKTWAWTSAIFFFAWFTSPPNTRTRERAGKWIACTVMWLIFTGWFFGPALIERFVLVSGGECILALPSGDTITVPAQHCLTRSSLSPTSHPDLFTSSSLIPPTDWHAMPRLRRGHDISGHIFLLTMSALFLTDQLRHSLSVVRPSTWHKVAIVANSALIGIWLFAIYTTGLFFHTPLEKLTGYLLGASCFAITLIQEAEDAARAKKAAKLHKN